MNYEKKYKEALERMKSWAKGEHPECFSEAQKAAEFIFPELKESEDERIRKRLICGMNALKEQKKETFATIPIDDAIAWLEKQEEKATHINREDCGIDGLYHAIKILEKTVGKVTGYQSDDGILEHKAAIDAVKELYKKQGGQEHFYDFNANDWYVSKVDGKIHDMTYNPSDKVEPKFKDGDWIVFNGRTLYIKEVAKGVYRPISKDGIVSTNYDWDIDNAARLWTIQDAKDGDVLVDKDNNIGLYLGEKDDLYWHSCIYLGCDGYIRGGFGIGGYHKYNNTKPATKEQRDTLFAKMKEAGYEWDNEKKELKEIEVKALDANEDFGL